jgi:hypothetical protein
LSTTTTPTTTTSITTISTAATQTTTTSTATTSTTTTPTTTTKRTTTNPPVICNKDGEYNNKTDIPIWPPVSPGEYSIANCSNGKGIAKWMCLSNGKFDEISGPDVSQCWINEIIDKIDNITSTDEVNDILDIVNNGTETDSSITSSDGIKDVIFIVEKLHQFVNNLTDIDSSTATNLTKGFINVLNNLIDQNKAWNHTNQTEITAIASKVLINIQYSAFIMSCHLNKTDQNDRILMKNIIVETYLTDFEQQIHFEANDSSISVPGGLEIDRDNVCNNSSVASLIDKLDNYLLGGMNNNQMINTKVIGFSLTNDNKTNQINNNKKVRMR